MGISHGVKTLMDSRNRHPSKENPDGKMINFRLSVQCKRMYCKNWLIIETDRSNMIETKLIQNGGHFTPIGTAKWYCQPCDHEYTQMKKQMRKEADQAVKTMIKERMYQIFEAIMAPILASRRPGRKIRGQK